MAAVEICVGDRVYHGTGEWTVLRVLEHRTLVDAPRVLLSSGEVVSLYSVARSRPAARAEERAA